MHAMVPNERVQQENGQRQDRRSDQTLGSASWQHTLSPQLLLTTSASALETDAGLSSNAQATPVNVSQSRGFQQWWVHGDLAGHNGRNDWKVGIDGLARHVHEQLSYLITDPSYFDPGTLPALDFAEQRWDSEPAAFAEDTFHPGSWNISAGLRFDRYAFLLHQNAWSPRLAVSRYLSSAHLVLHAAYDRIFQTPAVENLLLASSPKLDSVEPFVQRRPVQPAQANFYELGFTQEIAGRLRLTGNTFLRTFRNFADDDTLLNTGVSFPIAYASARISGEEVSLFVPDWHHVTLQTSYSNQTGTASGPVTGGLFLGDEGAEELAQSGRFPVSQDQRNTLRIRASWQPVQRFWLATHVQYNSGLPVELDDDVDIDSLEAAYGERVLREVNFTRGRVRPWSSIDLGAGLRVFSHGESHVDMEVHAANITDRVNVINFASLFSGTAIAAPRAIDARLRVSF